MRCNLNPSRGQNFYLFNVEGGRREMKVVDNGCYSILKLSVVIKYHLRKSVVRVSFSISAKRESGKSKQLWHLNADNFRAPVKIR